VLWTRYVQLTQIESVFRSLKTNSHTPHLSSTGASRRRAHSDRLPGLLFASDAKQRLLLHAPGLTRRRCWKKLADIKMIDVWIPTVDQRWLILLATHSLLSTRNCSSRKLKLQLPSSRHRVLWREKRAPKSRCRPSGRGGSFVVKTLL